MKPLYFILLNKELNKIFTVDGKLPQYHEMIESNASFNDSHIFNAWFQRTYGIEVFRRYAVDSATINASYYIMETVSHINQDIFQAINTLDKMTQEIISQIIKDYNKSYVCPWISNGFEMYLSWARELVVKDSDALIKNIKQIKNAYVSTVFQISTDKGNYYLKIPSTCFINEINIIEDLLKRKQFSVDVVGIHNSKTAYLMKDMGGCNLEDDFNLSHLYETIQQIADFQKEMTKVNNQEILSIYQEMTIGKMVEKLEAFKKHPTILLYNSPYYLTKDEEDKLLLTVNRYIKELKAIPDDIPYSIDHGDLRPGNIRIHTNKGQIIYDFAWSSYTHPFFTMISFFHILSSRYELKNEKDKLIDDYLSHWKDYSSIANLRLIYHKIEGLMRTYHVVIDMIWLNDVLKSYKEPYNLYSADGWLIDTRQMYFEELLKKII